MEISIQYLVPMTKCGYPQFSCTRHYGQFTYRVVIASFISSIEDILFCHRHYMRCLVSAPRVAYVGLDRLGFTVPPPCASRRSDTPKQGLTLVHVSAQRKRFLWDRGCIEGFIRGCLGGGREY